MLKKAQEFNRIRVLKSVEAIEDSIVTAPMNKRAAATGVKSDEIKTFVAQHGHEAIIQAINSELPEEDRYLKGISGSESFESFESVGAVLKKFTEDMQRNHANRVKEGRMLSDSNRKKVQAAYDALGELLTASEPAPKEPAEKEIDVDVLRTQSLRLRSQVMLTLARPQG